MNATSTLKQIVKIILIVIIILFNGLFINIFLFYDDSRELTYSNGAYFYSIIGLLLIGILHFLYRKDKLKNISRFQIEKTNVLDSLIIKRTCIRAIIKLYKPIFIFCLFEIILFIIAIILNDKIIWELLYFGLGIIILGILGEYLRIHNGILKDRFLESKFDCVLIEKEIHINSEMVDEVIKIKDIFYHVILDDYIFIETNVIPKYLIIKRKD
jgi:hypothetical protein